MPMIIRRTIFFWSLAAALGFFLVGYAAFGHDKSKVVADAAVIGASVAVCITWWEQFLTAIRHGVRDGGDNIIVTIFGTFATILLYFCYVVVYQVMGRPVWVMQSPAGMVFSVFFAAAGAYAILTPVNTGQALPKPRMNTLIFGVAAGAFVSGALVVLALSNLLQLDG